MTINEIITVKLMVGEEYDTAAIMQADTENTYSINTIIFLGKSTDITEITIDGIDLQLSGGFVLNQLNMNDIVINNSTYGVLLIGNKTKKTIFNF